MGPEPDYFGLFLEPVLEPGWAYSKGIVPDLPRRTGMNKQISKFAFVNRQQVQLVVALVSLAMLVLGIGAPGDGGGF